MKKAVVAVVVAAMGFVAAAPAFAGEGVVSAVDGKVMVRHGDAFVPASSGMKLVDGDIVSALDKGHAVVAYGGLCSAEVGAGTTSVVGPALCPPATTGQLGSVMGGDYMPLIIGGLVIGGGITAAVIVANRSNDGASN